VEYLPKAFKILLRHLEKRAGKKKVIENCTSCFLLLRNKYLQQPILADDATIDL